MYSRIYFDTAPLIYFLDRTDEFYLSVRDFIFQNYRESSQFYTSVLTDMEYLTFPYKVGDFQKVRNYLAFMKELDFKKVDMTEEICQLAARLRGAYSFLRQMDALHIACCNFFDCHLFLTNDRQLLQVKEVSVKLVEEL